jgi:hypothetical protein
MSECDPDTEIVRHRVRHGLSTRAKILTIAGTSLVLWLVIAMAGLLLYHLI